SSPQLGTPDPGTAQEAVEGPLEPATAARSLPGADRAADGRAPPVRSGHLLSTPAETPVAQPPRSAARSFLALEPPAARPVCAPAHGAAHRGRHHLSPPAAQCHPAVECSLAARLVRSSPTLCLQLDRGARTFVIRAILAAAAARHKSGRRTVANVVL